MAPHLFGGQFSDLWGGRRIDTATAVFSNGLVHQAVRDKVKLPVPSAPEASREER